MPPKAQGGSKRSGGHGGHGAKGNKSSGKGGGAAEGGAMATAVVQKKAVGGVSAGVEAQVRALLQNLERQEQQQQQQQQGGAGGGEALSAASQAVDSRTLGLFSALWDQLAAMGFSAQHVAQVVPELPRGQPSLEAALDWLCLHLPPAELPHRLKAAAAGGMYGAAPVRILSVAQQHPQQQQQQTILEGVDDPGGAAASGRVGASAWDDESGSESGSGSGSDESGAEDEAQGAGEGPGGGGPAGAPGGGAMKEWILRYMDEQGSSGDEGSQGAASCSSAAEFEWELWGDPREVARRRAERARSRLPVDQQRRQLAEEWARAKEVAARAKSAGDKARQKDAGLLIRDVKAEIKAMGVTEQQLEALVGGGAASDQRPAGDGKAKGQRTVSAPRPPQRRKEKPGLPAAAGAPATAAAAPAPSTAKGKGKDKGADKDKGKGKDEAGVRGKAKRKAKVQQRGAAPLAADSELDSEPEPQPQPAPVPAPPRPVAPKPQPEEPEEVPDSWEEREVEEEAAEQEAQAQVHAQGEAGVARVAGAEEVGVESAAAGATQQVLQQQEAPGQRNDQHEGRGALGLSGEADVGATGTSSADDASSAGGGDDEAHEQESEPVDVEIFDRSEGPASAADFVAAAPPGPAAAGEEPGFALPGLFDDDGGAEAGESTPAPSALLRAAAEDAAGRAPGKGGKRGTKPSAAAPATEQPKSPRALLAQQCQKHAWSRPRFERLPGSGAGGGGAFRYNVVLDLGPARGLAKKRNLHGIRVYALPARVQPDGTAVMQAWDDPIAAQDAAAARALYELAPALQLQQSTFLSLAPHWRQLWLEWEAADGAVAAVAAAAHAGVAAAAAGTAAAAAHQAEEAKLAVLRELLSRPPAPPALVPLRAVVRNVPEFPVGGRSAAAAAPGLAPSAVAPEAPAAMADEAAAPREAVPGGDAGEGLGEGEEGLGDDSSSADEAERDGAQPMGSHMEGGVADAVEAEEWEDMVASQVAGQAAVPLGGLDEEEEEEAVAAPGVGSADEQGPSSIEAASPAAAPVGVEGVGGETGGPDAAQAAAEAAAEAAAASASRSLANSRAAESATSYAMREALRRWQCSPAGAAMCAARGSLPIAAVRGEVLAALRSGDVVVVSGDTGCGKTTQVPQYLLEDAIAAGAGGATHVVVTQPRRIAAISVAERVADERGEPPPGSPGPASTTGYHVRLGAAVTRHTRLTFCTTGILLRRLAGDPLLRGVSHVVVDEVHERSLQSDFLIALLRDLLAARRMQRLAAAAEAAAGGGGVGAAAPVPPLKVVLMSATLDAKLFADYFGGCSVLHAAGRTYPVARLFLEDVYEQTGYRLAADAPAALRRHGPSASQQYARHAGGSRTQRDLVSRGFGDDESLAAPLNPHYAAELYGDRPLHVRRNLARLDEGRIDYDLLEALLAHIDATTGPGAVLVFLPGIGEINQLYDRLTAQRAYSTRGPASGARCVVLPLHSAVQPAGQRAALRPPSAGLRKVVLATNIAETSLTIEDVVAVVDTGKHKERRFNPARAMSMLVEDWVSAASAQQRAGRAGRVRPGVSYATYTQTRFDSGLRRYGVPEIMRVPLEELVLQILLMGLGPVSDFLSRVLEPPQPRAVVAALEVLKQVGALEPPTHPAALAAVEAAALAAAGGAISGPAGVVDSSGSAGGPHQRQQPGGGGAGQASAAAAGREVLSPLGRHLALLPVAPRLGKLLVVGALLGCLAPVATIAAAMSHKSPFLTPTEERAEAERARRALAAPGSEGIAAGQQSDHLLLVAAYELWRVASSYKHGGGPKAAALVAKRHFLHTQTLEALSDMRCQLAAMLADARLVQPGGGGRSGRGGGGGDGEGGGGGGKAAMAAAAMWLDDPTAPWNRFARDPEVIRAALCAALCPAVAVMGEESCPTSSPRWADSAPGLGWGEEVVVHPSSVVAGLATPQFSHPYLIYLEKVKTTRLYLRDVTVVSPLCLMLFGGPLTVLHAEGAVLVGAGPGCPGVRVVCRAQTAVLVKKLRGALGRLLERRFGGQGEGVWGGQEAETLIVTVRQMLREEDEQRSVALRLA